MPRIKEDPLAALLARPSPKAKSLIFTVYGDAISHRGGDAALGSVIALLQPRGVNERTVRTSMHRLAVEGWLQPRASGRRSDYRLTENGARRVDAAHARIYHHASRPWDRGWTLVVLGATELPAEVRQRLQRELGWLGFGRLEGGLMLHPDPDDEALRSLLGDVQLRVLVLRGAAASWVAGDLLDEVVRKGWDIARLTADYEAFLADFRPLWQALQRGGELEPERAFVARTLLMHDYRRVLLRDPMLPDELMPRHWPGAAARTLCRSLYLRVQAGAERYIESVLETAAGPAPGPAPSYLQRFGGLQSAA